MLRPPAWVGLLIVVATVGAGWNIRVGLRAKETTRPQPLVDLKGFGLTDITESVGITFRYEEPELDPVLRPNQRIVFLGSGIGVADYDGDGRMDLLMLTAKKGARNHLYLNQGGGRFIESAREWGIADTNDDAASVAPVVFDFDNDGRPDVFLASMGCSKLFRNTGTRFVDVSRASGLGDCRNSVGAVPFDLDNDGKLDLYVLRYWPALDYFHLASTKVFIDDLADARNGGANTLYRNRGDGTFEDVTAKAGGADTHWSLDGGVADLDGTGKPKLYVANDFGPDQLWSIEDGKLRNISPRLGAPDRRPGMDVSFTDLDHDGSPHVFVSNTWIWYFQLLENFLWKLPVSGLARDDARDRKAYNCGWAWGAGVADFDLDGEEDLYVANGFITGTGEKEYAFKAATTGTAAGVWMEDVGKWPALGTSSHSGHEVDCMFLSRSGRFANVSRQAGIDRDWDGRAVAKIDLENDGAMSVAVSTQNGPPHLLRNRIRPQGRWVGFRLEGTRSNRDGAGARLRVSRGGRSWYRWATAGKSGFLASSDPRLHFGLPESGDVELEVRWPSGLTQQFANVASGRYYRVTEARLKLEPL